MPLRTPDSEVQKAQPAAIEVREALSLGANIRQSVDVEGWFSLGLSGLALTYALLAGLRTAGDPDLGWQLATGRWIVEHRAIPYNDVLSFTAGNGEWIYSVLSQVLFYCAYLLGGYSLISWMTAAACVATTAVQMRGSVISKTIAIIAVPLIALRTAPRAELFTTVLFAIFVSILWRYHLTGRGRLFALPILMALWVNLHPGYLSGIGMCAAYVFLDAGELLYRDRRRAAVFRLRRAAPWLAAVLGSTVLNPWGIRNFVGTARLVPVQSNSWIMELMGISLTWQKVYEGVFDPRGSFWWLILVVIAAIVVALLQKRPATAVVLGVSLYFPFHAVRFQGAFATMAVVIAGSVLASGARNDLLPRLWQRIAAFPLRIRKVQLEAACLMALSAFVAMRGFDLVTNRFYLRTHYAWALFGPGVSPWYPGKAAEFVKQAELPGNLFNDYMGGGFVAWQLGPKYRDYIDGRGNGGGDLFFRSQLLLQSSLDSEAWKNESDQKQINSVFVTVDYEIGGGLASLNQYCKSSSFQLVFLDSKAAVFIRKTPQTEPLLRNIAKDCATVSFNDPPAGTTARAKAERFLYFRNAAAILITLGRDSDSLTKSSAALELCPHCGDAHFIRAVALYSSDPTQAEVQKELELSVQLDPGDLNSEYLAGRYRRIGRFRDAFKILNAQIGRSGRPFRLLMLRGFVEVDLNSLDAALHSFDEAETSSPYRGENLPVEKQFRSELAQGRANAWWKISTDLERRGLHEQAVRARDQYEFFQQQAPPAE